MEGGGSSRACCLWAMSSLFSGFELRPGWGNTGRQAILSFPRREGELSQNMHMPSNYQTMAMVISSPRSSDVVLVRYVVWLADGIVQYQH